MSEAKAVAIIGAGPVGLAAAAHLLERGLEPIVLEAGDHVGHAMRQWGHVQSRYISRERRRSGGAVAGDIRMEFARAGSVPDGR